MDYVEVREAVNLPGLKLVLSAGVPGGRCEAAKAIFKIKGLDYIPVRQEIGASNEDLRQWTGQVSAPVAVYNNERPKVNWDEILLLAERLMPYPPLIPEDEDDRVLMFGICHAICGEDGFSSNMRVITLADVEEHGERCNDISWTSMDTVRQLRARYAVGVDHVVHAPERVRAVLSFLTKRLRAQIQCGSRYLVGNRLTAADIYWSALSIQIMPFAPEDCPAPPGYCAPFYRSEKRFAHLLDPVILEHRQYVVTKYFGLPMRF